MSNDSFPEIDRFMFEMDLHDAQEKNRQLTERVELAEAELIRSMQSRQALTKALAKAREEMATEAAEHLVTASLLDRLTTASEEHAAVLEEKAGQARKDLDEAQRIINRLEAENERLRALARAVEPVEPEARRNSRRLPTEGK